MLPERFSHTLRITLLRLLVFIVAMCVNQQRLLASVLTIRGLLNNEFAYATLSDFEKQSGTARVTVRSCDAPDGQIEYVGSWHRVDDIIQIRVNKVDFADGKELSDSIDGSIRFMHSKFHDLASLHWVSETGFHVNGNLGTFDGTSIKVGNVMSGCRPLIKGFFRRCADRGCGHVFGLVRGEFDPLALMLSADPLPRSRQRA